MRFPVMVRTRAQRRTAATAAVRAVPRQRTSGPSDGGGRRRGLDLDPAGLAVATAFAMLAMTPSLLPRDWLFQGLVSGLSAGAGYGAGVALGWAVRRSARWHRFRRAVRRQVRRRLPTEVPPWAPRAARAAMYLTAAAAVTLMLLVAAQWQQEVASLTATEQTTTGGWLRAGPLLVAVAAAVVVLARAVRWLARLLGRLLHWARLPRPVASVGGGVLAAALLVTLVNDVMLHRALAVADQAFTGVNEGSYPGVQQPLLPTRSGSPTSLVTWDSLGKEGRSFVAGGLSREELAAAATGPVADPVRAYVGLDRERTAMETAELAVAELEHAGGLHRAVVVVVTTTGRGWVNPVAADSIELMYGGDTAIVATQYSYLPSWLSFVADRTRAAEAGRLLFDAVSARIRQLPEEQRPRLLVYGESLGAQGSENAFSTLTDIRTQADGVLWVAPPNSNPLWSALVARRDPGTPEVEPVYSGGLVVRFAGDAADLAEPPSAWLEPRVLYLQHPSDPVVWWSTGLLFDRPDWLVEPRGDDVSPAMSWYPVVTFWQVSADMANAANVPHGHGHMYDDLILDAWAAVAAPEGWTDADTERVRKVLPPRPESR